MRILLAFSIIILLTVSFSCRKAELIGREVQVGNNDILLITNDSIHISATTKAASPERTDERFEGMLGAYIDPIFGSNVISYTSQYNLEQEGFAFPTDAIFDSAFVSFRLTGGYREKELASEERSLMHFQVFEIAEDINTSQIYYSDHHVKTQPNLVGEYIGSVGLSDTVYVDGVSQPSQIRIPLNTNWGEKIISADSSHFVSNESFIAFMKGLTIQPVQTNSSNSNGAIFYFNPLSGFTGITIHYHTPTDTTKFSFITSSLTANFMTFEHDYSNSPIGSILDDTAVGSDILYLQSTIGTDVELELKDIAAAFATNPKVINIAELFIPVDTTQPYYPLNKLAVSRKLANGAAEFLPDQVQTGARIIDGNLNSDSAYYRFLITQYVQDIIHDYVPGSDKSEKLLISPFGNNTLANRSVISGPRPTSPGKSRMKVVITYTPLN
ncbi:MAG: hypothetical protein ACI8SA_002412 [Dokdonia sp.]|jgi:hypothetical protein